MKNKKILIIDDDPAIVELLKVTLSHYNYIFIIATDG